MRRMSNVVADLEARIAELEKALGDAVTADAPPEPTDEMEIIARWLYRRYAIKNDRVVTWELQGGKVKGPWCGDARGILDALAAAQPDAQKERE